MEGEIFTPSDLAQSLLMQGKTAEEMDVIMSSIREMREIRLASMAVKREFVDDWGELE